MLVLSHEGKSDAGGNVQPGKCSRRNRSNCGERYIYVDERTDSDHVWGGKKNNK